MYKHLLFCAAIACSTVGGSPQGYCLDGGQSQSSTQAGPEAARVAVGLLDDIAAWLASNFDLAAVQERPAVQFASKMTLARMHASDQAHWRGLTQSQLDQPNQRQVIALYDTKSKTIFLPDDWLGTTLADKSVLVHEMVHHIQNVAQLEFECPMAREKLAYLAQDKWLKQFGTSLEKEFDVDMFTVLISSACAAF